MDLETQIITPLKIDRTKLYTQNEYAKKVKLTRGRISQLVKEGKLPIVKINGATLIYEG
jgi:hypothetical protein